MCNTLRILILFLVTACLYLSCASDNPPGNGYARLPYEIDRTVVTRGGDTLVPVRLQLVGDSLFVSYRGVPRVDILNKDLDIVGSVDLRHPLPVIPTSFFVADSEIVVVDHSRNAILLYDRSGVIKTSFSTLPDGRSPLSPFCVTYFGGVAYIGDGCLGGILAVSLADAPGITEVGELILTIPSDPEHQLEFPSAVFVTPDGRLLAGDAGKGSIEVFTCDGRHIYSFHTPPINRSLAPQAFAMDNIVDPSLQDSTRFDPSLVHLQGRIHVPDANNGRVHMFNPLGEYIGSYPGDAGLESPSGIAIDRVSHRIYVADPSGRVIITYAYTP